MAYSTQFEAFSTTYTPVKDVLSPHLMNNDTVVGQSDNSRNSEASMEYLQGHGFSLEKCMDPMILGEAEEGPGLVKPSDEEYHNAGEKMQHLDAKMNSGGEGEPPYAIKSFNHEQHVNAELMKFSGITPPDSRKHQNAEKWPMSLTIDATPESKFPDASGAATPEFMAVRTPATKEHARVLNKRKCIFDDIIVFPNKVLKQRIDNSSDLVCKRRKAPCTAIHAWKAHKISSLPKSFLEPLIPCTSLDVRSRICEQKLQTPAPVETVKIPTNVGVSDSSTRQKSSNYVEIPANVAVLESPIRQRSPEQTPIAPATPVTHSPSLRIHDVQGITRSDRVGPASSSETESIEESSPTRERELDISLMHEETNSCEGNSQEKQKWSLRTRYGGQGNIEFSPLA
ncbi:unnamed protein product [Ilex paraguariensis]|uniref:Uncharacterized protein n=1 Tax=Ilex paraguariensis TaxID=185542 RepID=A0ABC8V0U0_9AQUA